MGRMPWRELSNHWSVIFTGAVIVFFLLSTISLPKFGNPFAADDGVATSAPTSTTTELAEAEPENVSLSSQVKVKSFYLDNGPPLAGEITLEVRNSGAETMTFRPSSLALRQIGGSSTTPTDIETNSIDIAAGRTTVVPVTFPVRANPGANYELTYSGNKVFSGRPV